LRINITLNNLYLNLFCILVEAVVINKKVTKLLLTFSIIFPENSWLYDLLYSRKKPQYYEPSIEQQQQQYDAPEQYQAPAYQGQDQYQDYQEHEREQEYQEYQQQPLPVSSTTQRTTTTTKRITTQTPVG